LKNYRNLSLSEIHIKISLPEIMWRSIENMEGKPPPCDGGKGAAAVAAEKR
jgi:hypothetical protein